ncbi:MAG: glycoside hydrolase family 20 zincin-like fold domain-containing protein, partial [Planctomycetota bacterium]
MKYTIKSVLVAVLLLTFSTSPAFSMAKPKKLTAVTSIRIHLPTDKNISADALAEVMEKQIQLRCPASVKTSGKADYTIKLSIDKKIEKEGFRIEDAKNNSVKITGNDLKGLVYGTGKFLRTSRYTKDAFIPSHWRGTSIPKNPIRGIYFATHFFNYYHVAPIEEIKSYVEELALYGYNNIVIWFDMHHFNGINDPNAQEMIKRLKAMMLAGKKLG